MSLTLPSCPRFTVSGYYGCGNVGDEAVLAAIAQTLRSLSGGSASVTALSEDPEQTHALHGLNAVHRMHLGPVRAQLRNTDLLLSGGGSLLQDTTSVRSLVYYLWICRMARAMGVPYMFYAQGIGPLKRRSSRFLVRLVANRACYITVRDEPSARLLTSIGVSKPVIEVTADPVFALTPASEDRVDALLTAEGLAVGSRMIGLALRAWGEQAESAVSAYVRLVDAITHRTGVPVALLSMHRPRDLDFARLVKSQISAPEQCALLTREWTPAELLGLVGRMEAVVAMRLHALIFAIHAGVPPFALAYDPKVESLMRGIGLQDSMEGWRGFDPNQVADRVGRLIEVAPDRRDMLRASGAGLERMALRNAECALRIVETSCP